MGQGHIVSEAATGLSGYWSGWYDYPHSFSPVSFNAQLIETGLSITGSVTEPDLQDFFGTVIVLSTLEGSREGETVRFVKRMQNAGPQSPIHYTGFVNKEQTQVVT